MTVSTTPLYNAYQGGTFAFYTHMDYTKQPLDYPQIIQLLRQRGLQISNDNQAIEFLKIISYFRLANYLKKYSCNTASVEIIGSCFIWYIVQNILQPIR